jgi:hypothetical protein
MGVVLAVALVGAVLGGSVPAGGFTKLHPSCEGCGRLLSLMVTEGQRFDST